MMRKHGSPMHFREVASNGGEHLELDRHRLTALPPPLARRVIVRALRTVAGIREVNQEHVEGVLALAAGETGGLDVPGGRMEPRAGKLVLIQQKAIPK